MKKYACVKKVNEDNNQTEIIVMSTKHYDETYRGYYDNQLLTVSNNKSFIKAFAREFSQIRGGIYKNYDL